MNTYNNTAKSEIISMVSCKRVNDWGKSHGYILSKLKKKTLK